ncbi:ImmA/IrrE family metallo-endopeptidase [Archangium sp.]|uniref:ImmA/IrrE family metallo-endopeptidase n=1 Tax=Archangium sp. TaxID=1872627 RepID=UPI003899E64B
MTRRWLEEAVAACGLSPPLSFPRNLAAEVGRALPVSLVYLPGLTCGRVRNWLARKGVKHHVSDDDRPLHGCLVARAGKGFLFIDEGDDTNEQRFTLAHEVSHFVLDHLLLRARARRTLGRDFLPVLEGQRDPTPHETLVSVFHRVSVGVQVRLMERNASGDPCSGKAMEAEFHADRLAFELLAPVEEALPLVRRFSRREAEAELASRFGLPLKESRSYVRWLLAQEPARRPFFLKFAPMEEQRSYG